ncbi:hypothetical protein [Desulfosporosinus fructosivorans]
MTTKNTNNANHTNTNNEDRNMVDLLRDAYGAYATDKAPTKAPTNTDRRFNEGRDSRSANEILRDAYAASSDYAILLAEHAQRAKEAEEQRLKRIETGVASANELLAEGFKRLGDQAQSRKEAKIQRAKIAQEKEEQERQARLDAVYGGMKR